MRIRGEKHLSWLVSVRVTRDAAYIYMYIYIYMCRADRIEENASDYMWLIGIGIASRFRPSRGRRAVL